MKSWAAGCWLFLKWEGRVACSPGLPHGSWVLSVGSGLALWKKGWWACLCDLKGGCFLNNFNPEWRLLALCVKCCFKDGFLLQYRIKPFTSGNTKTFPNQEVASNQCVFCFFCGINQMIKVYTFKTANLEKALSKAISTIWGIFH